jgi:hypothetical protein
VAALSRFGTHANFGLYFDPATGVGDLMLRRVVCEPGWNTLHREFTALMVARKFDILPIVDRYQILPDGLIQGRAALSRLLPGQSLNALKSHPQFLGLCQQVGAVMAKLPQHTQPHFGCSPNNVVFLPTAPTWKGEWQRWIDHWVARANRVGELSSGRQALCERLADRVSSLDDVDVFSLVHGDLHSGNFLATEDNGELTLSGIIDWEQARIGDALVDWAVVLNAPADVLAEVVKGYGPDRVRALLEPSALARLEVYYFTHVLARIGVLTSDLFRIDGGRNRAMALVLTQQHVQAALNDNTVKQRLEAALGGVAKRAAPVADSRDILVQRALQVALSGPPVRADDANDYLLCLSASAMANRTDGDISERYTQLGHALCDRLGPQSVRFNETSPTTQIAVKTRVFDSVMARQGPGMSLAISLLAGCVTAAEEAGAVHEGVWSGLSALLESVLFLEENSPPLQGLGQLAHALMGLDAALVLNAPSGVVARYGATLAQFKGIDSGEAGGAAKFLQQGPPAGIPTGNKGKALMPLILAMARLEAGGRLNSPAATILQQLGFMK